MLRSARHAPPRGPVLRMSVAALATLLVLVPDHLMAQNSGLKLAVGDVGVGIGDVRRIDGVRFNFRDREMERVRGLNVTLWEPFEENRGSVYGIALGLPLTGARNLAGVGLGLGVAAERDFLGIGIGLLGLGAGESMRGVAVGGIGLGSGGDLACPVSE